jgi:triosephosphate isomerase
MLKQFKISYAIIGHSERRSLGESDQQINAKLQRALQNKVTPILCVGYGLAKEASEEDVMNALAAPAAGRFGWC